MHMPPDGRCSFAPLHLQMQSIWLPSKTNQRLIARSARDPHASHPPCSAENTSGCSRAKS
jgi:hypothetical protein